MDINRRKPKVINLRKHKKIVSSIPISSVKIEVSEIRPEVPTIEAESFLCMKCGTPEAPEFGRCKPCEIEHKKLVSELDAKPRSIVERPQQEWVTFKQNRGGIIITVHMTKEEAIMMGHKVPGMEPKMEPKMETVIK